MDAGSHAARASGRKRKRVETPAEEDAARHSDQHVDEAEGGEDVGMGGFAAAMQKVMGRQLRAGAPVLAKRHTAAAKLAAAARAEQKQAQDKLAKRKELRKSHMAEPSAYAVDYERQLRRVATRGGASAGSFDRPSHLILVFTIAFPRSLMHTYSPFMSIAVFALAVVSFFNEIAKHQQRVAEAEAAAGRTTERVAAVAAQQSSFLELLKRSTSGSSSAAASSSTAGAAAAASSSSAASAGSAKWKVLSDDYVHSKAKGRQDEEAGDDSSEGEGDDGLLDSGSDDDGY